MHEKQNSREGEVQRWAGEPSFLCLFNHTFRKDMYCILKLSVENFVGFFFKCNAALRPTLNKTAQLNSEARSSLYPLNVPWTLAEHVAFICSPNSYNNLTFPFHRGRNQGLVGF